MTISATHTNKKTGMEVCAWVNSHKASNGETSITYRKVKNGQMTGPLITSLESKFLANYGEA
jgi:hypothetical protein